MEQPIDFADQQVIQQARELVGLLEQGDLQQAKQVLDGLASLNQQSLFFEIGKLTRQLHEALANFQLDGKIAGLAAHDIPDAKERLNYVIETTENAANTTMDSVEKCIPMAENIQANADDLLKDWGRFKRREMEAGEFRELATRMEQFLASLSGDSTSLHTLLTEVLMAQGYQDLTGQVIRRVITLVQDVEESLVEMIKMFGATVSLEHAQANPPKEEGAQGPAIDKSKDDVMASQDEVDDLLSSLGF